MQEVKQTAIVKKYLLTDYSYGGSGFPLGRGRQMFVNGMNSYGH